MAELPTLESRLDKLEVKLDKLIELASVQTRLQMVALLGSERIFNFNYRGQTIRMYLPDAEIDGLQQHILRSGTFFECNMLETLAKTDLINSKSIVYDVGANIGNHSVYFSTILKAKKVVSFEPQPHCFRTLEKNLELNNVTSSVTVNSMVGAKAGKGEVLHFIPSNHGATRLVDTKDGSIDMVSIDKYTKDQKERRVDFIKIDVEGKAPEALEGARGVLEKMRPAVWAELLPRFLEVEPALAIMDELGYEHTQLSRLDYLFTPKP